MSEQVKNEYNDRFKNRLRSVLELDEFEFLKNKREVERGMSEGLWIGVHEGSLLCRLAVMEKECGGMCGNELSTDDCPQERWNMMDDGEHWVVYYTPSNRAKIPLIDWDRVSDVREAVVGPVESDIVRTFDGDLFTRINDMVWHTDNEEDSPYVVNPSQCKAFGRDINLKDIVEKYLTDKTFDPSKGKEAFASRATGGIIDTWWLCETPVRMISSCQSVFVPPSNKVIWSAADKVALMSFIALRYPSPSKTSSFLATLLQPML